MISNQTIRQIVNLLHEIGMLSNIPRSGFAFLGSGNQSVAEHSFRVALTAFSLAQTLCHERELKDHEREIKDNCSSNALKHVGSSQSIDMHKLVMMCLFHDLPEARIGDLNYVQKKYLNPNLDKSLKEIESSCMLGPQVTAWISEYEERKSLEAQLAHDADQLEFLIVLKCEEEKGNLRAKEWMPPVFKRLKTDVAKKFAETICTTPTDEWWCEDKADPHWIDGGKSKATT